jgi:hypothetical protein
VQHHRIYAETLENGRLSKSVINILYTITNKFASGEELKPVLQWLCFYEYIPKPEAWTAQLKKI